MKKFEIEKELTDGLKIIKLNPFTDERGEYIKIYSKQEFVELGIETEFLDDNYLISKKSSFRGLHFQKLNPEAKLLRCLEGKILDIVVDMRETSKTYKKIFKIELEANDRKMLYIPEGFAHGFLSITDSTIFYKSSNYYFSGDQYGLNIMTKEIETEFKNKYSIEKLIMTEKDKKLPKII